MSIEVMSAIFKCPIKPCGRKFVAIALANFADEKGSCFPSVRKLCQFTSQSERTVRTHLSDLDNEGYIEAKRTRREDGNYGVNRYQFDLGFIQRQFSPAAIFANGEKRPKPAAKIAGQEPSIEPSIDNSLRSLSSAHANELVLASENPVSEKLKKASRLKENWQASEQDVLYARQKGFTDMEIVSVASNFKNYWLTKSGKDATKLRWDLVWQTWINNDLKWKASRGGGAKTDKQTNRRSNGERYDMDILAGMAADLERQGR